jgi:hypothetical protein
MEGLQNIKNSKSGSVYHHHRPLISLVLAQITPKKDLAQIRFIKDLVLHVCKGYKNISIVQYSWFRRMVMKRDPKVEFPICRQFVLEYLPNMIAKAMDRNVLLLLANMKLQISFFIFGCP